MKLTEIVYYCTENKVCESEFIEVSPLCRLYYLPTQGYDIGGGFDFCGLTIEDNHYSHPDYKGWDGDVNYFFSGGGVLDGVRHMFMSCDDEMDRGYQNYPDLELIIIFFTELKKLENKYCSDFFE